MMHRSTALVVLTISLFAGCRASGTGTRRAETGVPPAAGRRANPSPPGQALKAKAMRKGEQAPLRAVRTLDQIQTLRILDAKTVHLISAGWMLRRVVAGGIIERRYVVEAETRAVPLGVRRDLGAELPTELTLRVGQTCRAGVGSVWFDHRLEKIEGGRAVFHSRRRNRAGRETEETVAVASYGLAFSLRTDKTRYRHGVSPMVAVSYQNAGASPLLIKVNEVAYNRRHQQKLGRTPPLYSLRWLELLKIDGRGRVIRTLRVIPLQSTMFGLTQYHELAGGARYEERAPLLSSFWVRDDRDSQPLERLGPGRYRLQAEYHRDPLPEATISAAKRFLQQPDPTAERFAQSNIIGISLAQAQWLHARDWRLWGGTLHAHSRPFTVY